MTTRFDNRFMVGGLRATVRGMVRRRPGLTLAALTILALGIGANTALFTLLDATLIHPLPYRDSERLVYLWELTFEGRSQMWAEPPADVFRAWREGAKSFEDMVGFDWHDSQLEAGGNKSVPVRGLRVSPGFFAFLGYSPTFGRGFVRDDARPSSEPIVVIDDKLWRKHFGSDPEVLGRAVDLNGEDHLIVGILPPEFRLLESPAAGYFVPLTEAPDGRQLTVLARLRDGVSQEAAAAELSVISSAHAARTDRTDHPAGAKLITPQERLNHRLRNPILWLQATAALVLLIACANVAHLLLAKGELREHELVMRAVVGADRGQLLRQLLLESIVLSFAAGALGLLVAAWGLETILALAPPTLDHLQGLELNLSSLGFAFALTLLTGLLFGLLPALQGSLPDLAASLKQSLSSAAATRQRHSMHQLLVATQVAVSFVLLLGALLLLRELDRLGSLDYGFAVEDVWTAWLEMPGGGYLGEGPQVALLDQLREAIDLPHVEVVLASGLPSSAGIFPSRPELEGRSETGEPVGQIIQLVVGSPGYFRVLEIPLRQGRGFTEEDRRLPEPPLVINETLANRLSQGESPVGRRLSLNPGSWHRIVGVAADTLLMSRGGSRPQIYLPYWESPLLANILVVRATENPGPVLETLEAKIRAVDPGIAIGEATAAVDLHGQAFVQERFNSLLTVLFAALAVSLMAVGIYGTATWAVLRRIQEIGIRAALGAEHRQLLGQMLGRSLYPVAAGLAVGVVAAAGLTRIAEGFIAGLVSGPSSTYVVVAVGVAATALAAAWLPANRAAQVNPVEVLRRE